jgi:iron complex transport system substrate-binding protein
MLSKLKIVILFALCIATLLNANSAIDMVGREVKIPPKVQKVFSASPPMTILLYSLAPETMIGVNYRFFDIEKEFMLKDVAELPILGSFYSASNQANLEKVLALSPDIVFMWDIMRKNGAYFEDALEKFDIPTAYIAQNTIPEMLDALKIMGIFLKKEKRAEKLVAYAKNNLQRVKQSVDNLENIARKKVYMAQGSDGLTTECTGNMQSQIIPLVGGTNVHQCEGLKEGTSRKSKITLETLYKYDPDVIFVWDKSFYDSIKDLSAWRNLSAYKNNQIYFAPISPFNWLSRPPSIMRFLGALWMHNKLYPEHFKIDINEEVRNFYKLFLHVDLSNEQINKLIKGE